MSYILDSQLEKILEENAPFGDLTTQVLGVKNRHTEIVIIAKNDIISSCTEEAVRIFELTGSKASLISRSGDRLGKGEVLLVAEGECENIMLGWRAAQGLLEYCCGVSTLADRFTQKLKESALPIALLFNTQSIPSTRKFASKAALSGGAMPHRLGLSDSILIYPEHLKLFKNKEEARNQISQIKAALPGKKIILEARSEKEALEAMQFEVDALQLDRFSPSSLKKICSKIQGLKPEIALLAVTNTEARFFEEYIMEGISGIVSGAIFYAPPAELKVTISRS
ncbi:ModD protein [Wolinella succinogenes]|uniref:ModD protein n=1 Tax=Wolinella succinogenes TaxID=844 RepID=UPI00240A33C8|nr:ModD protein [Wolinella succinogenes]